MNKSVVDIIMVTYNQEKYIAQAIESVLMQRTEFPFRLLIGEDCSTDHTKGICIEYAKRFPGKIKLISHSTNQGLLKNYKSLFDISTAQYFAILEGDDYWIDQNKLQMQFDYLEIHSEVGLHHTNCNLLFETGKIFNASHLKEPKEILKGESFNGLLLFNSIRPLTVMMRRELYENYVDIDEYIYRGFKTFDFPCWLDIAPHCKFEYSQEKTAIYRIHRNSLSNSNNYESSLNFENSTYAIKEWAIKKNSSNSSFLLDKLYQQHIISRLGIEFNYGTQKQIQVLSSTLSVNNFKSFIYKIISHKYFPLSLYREVQNFKNQFNRGY